MIRPRRVPDPPGDDVERFVTALKRVHPQMRSLAVRVCRNSSTADDALQNAYIKAYKAQDSFRGDADIATWLYRIVYRSCLDELRRLKPVVPLDASVPGRDPGFEERVDDSLHLRRALGELTAEQRAAVWLVDAEGHTYAAAAQILEVPEGTVASRVVRAREALRRALGTSEEHTEDGR